MKALVQPLPGVFPFQRGDRVRVTATHHEGPGTVTFIKSGPERIGESWAVGVVGIGVVPVDRIRTLK